MLKKVSLSNFIHFRDEQILEFEEGASFLIGCNRSGKSSVFEAIRRCMSTSKSFFISTHHDNKKPLIVICEFADKVGNKTIYSCFVSIFPNRSYEHNGSRCGTKGMEYNDENGLNPIAIKIFFVKEASASGFEQIHDLAVDLLKANTDCFPVNSSFELITQSLTLSEELKRHLGKEKIGVETINSFVEKYIIASTEYNFFLEEKTEDYDGSTMCETNLKRYVDDQVVITEPMRSICPVQWTRSRKMDITKRTRDRIPYIKELRERSEILAWYLEENQSEDDKKKVTETFKILTNNSNIEFKKTEGGIFVYDDGNTVSLPKAPEGFFEAMECSILVSIKEFKTVCIEEPGRGMHMQMVERLRDLVLKKMINKTVIIITHIPTFLSSWNIENIFFCKGSITNDNRTIFNVTKVRDIFRVMGEEENKTRRIITSSTMATIFFVQRVLLVEGNSDLLFMTELKAILLENESIMKSIFSKLGRECLSVEKFQHFLSSLHILPLHGEQNKLRVELVCQTLTLERYFLLDYDAIFDEKDKREKCTKFFRGFNLHKDETLTEQIIINDVSVLEKKGVFIWKRDLPPDWKDSLHPDLERAKGGTIEYALFCLCEINQDLKDTFETNNACLEIKTKTSSGKVKAVISKLFKKRELTDRNISNVVEVSTDKTESDVFRFLKFLVQSFMEVRT